jgi:penicillin V acylase-like amidase (Ntn superfamily)
MKMKVIYNENNNIRVEIEKISDRPYCSMKYYGDYCFEKYLKEGSCNIEEFCKFVDKNLILNKNIITSNNAQGCAAFTAYNMEGDILFARNMDCECAIPMRILLNNDDSYKSLSFINMAELDWDENTYNTLETDAKLTLAAPYSPLDGINEYGLTVACLTDSKAVYPKHNKITLFDETLPRLILNKSKTVDEAIRLIDNYNLFFIVAPRHFLVADVYGDSAVIEFVNGKMVIVKKSKDYHIVTNFTLYNNPNHEGFGRDRYENIKSELDKRHGIISENEALDLLKKNVIPGDEQWSAVYNLTKRSVLITFSREYNNIYKYEL